MNSSTVLEVLLITAGLLVFAKILKMIDHKFNTKFVKIFGIIVACGCVVLPRIVKMQYRHKNRQNIAHKVISDKHINTDTSNNTLYFMTFDWASQMDLINCIFTESGPTSCETKCIKVTIRNDSKVERLREKIQCAEEQKRSVSNKEIKFSNTYYLSDYATCVEDTTDYTVTNIGSTNCPDISCRLLKNDVAFHQGFHQCRPLGFPSFTNLISEKDFIEITKPKLRNNDELKRLYEKYYKDEKL